MPILIEEVNRVEALAGPLESSSKTIAAPVMATPAIAVTAAKVAGALVGGGTVAGACYIAYRAVAK